MMADHTRTEDDSHRAKSPDQCAAEAEWPAVDASHSRAAAAQYRKGGTRHRPRLGSDAADKCPLSSIAPRQVNPPMSGTASSRRARYASPHPLCGSTSNDAPRHLPRKMARLRVSRRTAQAKSLGPRAASDCGMRADSSSLNRERRSPVQKPCGARGT